MRSLEPSLGDGLISCVIDEDPEFHLEALRWFATATRLASVPPSALRIHVIGDIDSDVVRWLVREGVVVRHVDRFDVRSPHCNKISGALSIAEERFSGVIVLTDADIGFLEDPRALEFAHGSLAGKIVDGPNPRGERLENVFRAAGLPVPGRLRPDFDDSDFTVEGNLNGGFYAMRGPVLSKLAPAWARWARWLLERPELLGESATFTDQVGMALALVSEQVPWHPLGARWNTPTHMAEWLPAHVEPPAIIHYHKEVEPTALLARRGHQVVDRAIDVVNDAVAHVLNTYFPSETFREWRTRHDPEFGSESEPG